MISTTKVVKYMTQDNLIWDNLKPSRQNQKLILTASKESVPLTLYEHKGLENRIREESCQSTGG